MRGWMLAVVIVASWACSLERRFIFYPDKVVDLTPGRLGMKYEEVYFRTDDGLRLHGWFVPAEGAGATLVWFHGNAGNISHRVDNLKLFHDRLQVNVFLFDYREYGKSEGVVSEEGTYRDGEAALRYLAGRTDVDPRRIVLFGQSLGTAVAVELAARGARHPLILEAPFTSIVDMARRAFPFLPVSLLVRTRYDSIAKIERVAAPVLILHGDRDEMIPYRQGLRLFEAAKEPKEFFTIVGARHNDTHIAGGEPYLRALRSFIRRFAGDVAPGRTPA